jgi:hypothetical protein
MLEEQRWGLTILVSQKACEGPSKTHLAWGAWGGPVEKLLQYYCERIRCGGRTICLEKSSCFVSAFLGCV